jgi:hypothetical protein
LKPSHPLSLFVLTNHSSTIMEKVLNEYGNEPKMAIAYFYFDFAERKKQSIKSCLSSLIAQICQQRIYIPDEVQSLYYRHHHKPSTAQPMTTELLSVLSATTEGLEVFLICDALDECGSRSFDKCTISHIIGKPRQHQIFGNQPPRARYRGSHCPNFKG